MDNEFKINGPIPFMAIDTGYIDKLLDGKKEQVTEAVKKAVDSFDSVRDSFYDKQRIEELRAQPASEENSREIDTRGYLFELLETYITSDPSYRRMQMNIFADNYQVGFDEVKEILGYFGLEI
jgi:hypothetical protein